LYLAPLYGCVPVAGFREQLGRDGRVCIGRRHIRDDRSDQAAAVGSAERRLPVLSVRPSPHHRVRSTDVLSTMRAASVQRRPSNRELSMGPLGVTRSNPTHQLIDPTRPSTSNNCTVWSLQFRSDVFFIHKILSNYRAFNALT